MLTGSELPDTFPVRVPVWFPGCPFAGILVPVTALGTYWGNCLWAAVSRLPGSRACPGQELCSLLQTMGKGLILLHSKGEEKVIQDGTIPTLKSCLFVHCSRACIMLASRWATLSCSVDLDLSHRHFAASGIILLQGRRLMLALNCRWGVMLGD